MSKKEEIDDVDEWAKFDSDDIKNIKVTDVIDDDEYNEDDEYDEDDEGMCGELFTWTTSDDVPLQEMIEYAAQCNRFKVWRVNTKLCKGEELMDSNYSMAIIGAKTKQEAINVLLDVYIDEDVDYMREEGIVPKYDWPVMELNWNFIKEQVTNRIIPWKPEKYNE